jgi:hypothetical protein
MYLLRTIDRNAYEEIVSLEKPAPILIEPGSVSLKGIVDLLAAFVFRLQFNRFFKEFKASKSGLAALPGKSDQRNFLRFNELLDIAFKKFISHFETAAFCIQFLFFQIIAVGTVKITNRANGLGHYHK